jgi:predicted RNA-binding Zn-ribbon protein involved in translation (DUF1610 family)
MVTYGKMLMCNRCGNKSPLFADDGEYKNDAWYVSVSCPTCGDKMWTAIRKNDDNIFEYNIGD